MDRRPRIDRFHRGFIGPAGFIGTIAKSQRENVIAAQRQFRETETDDPGRPRFRRDDLRRWFGKKPEGEWEDIADRYRPGVETDEGWDNFIDNMNNQLRCRIKAEYYPPDPRWPDEPLLAITVDPLDDMPTNRPAHSETPWHISLGFYSTKYGPIKDAPKEEKAAYRNSLANIQERYAEWAEVILRGEVEGGTFALFRNSPIANDPDIRYVHDNSHYHDRAIHMTW